MSGRMKVGLGGLEVVCCVDVVYKQSYTFSIF